MSILSKKEIEMLMMNDNPDKRLVITPMFDKKEQINDGAVDVRLGFQFIIIKRTEFTGLDPKDSDNLKKNIDRYQGMMRVRFRQPFVLHPHQLVLGTTLEYISLPDTIAGYVLSRSSWGRLGLIIATATYVNPGFKGCLTLELENLGEAPLVLYPGLRIAQLVLHTLKGTGHYGGKYTNPTGPEFSKVYNDKELVFWTPQKEDN